MDPAKQNASGEGGAYTTKLAGCVSGQELFDFNAHHISSACRALHRHDCGQICIDGLHHAYVARYVPLEHRAGMASLQGERYLGEPS